MAVELDTLFSVRQVLKCLDFFAILLAETDIQVMVQYAGKTALLAKLIAVELFALIQQINVQISQRILPLMLLQLLLLLPQQYFQVVQSGLWQLFKASVE